MLAPLYFEKKNCKKENKTRAQVKNEIRERALQLLDKIGLAEKADVYPSKLSGVPNITFPCIMDSHVLVFIPLPLMIDFKYKN